MNFDSERSASRRHRVSWVADLATERAAVLAVHLSCHRKRCPPERGYEAGPPLEPLVLPPSHAKLSAKCGAKRITSCTSASLPQPRLPRQRAWCHVCYIIAASPCCSSARDFVPHLPDRRAASRAGDPQWRRAASCTGARDVGTASSPAALALSRRTLNGRDIVGAEGIRAPLVDYWSRSPRSLLSTSSPSRTRGVRAERVNGSSTRPAPRRAAPSSRSASTAGRTACSFPR